MNETTCTVIGFVATEVRHRVTSDGVPVASFRLGTTPRRWDRNHGWTNGETSFYTVTCFRSLARNLEGSVHKRDPVVVHGRLRVANWEAGDRSGTSAEIVATSIGHDLQKGTAAFVWSRSEQPDVSSVHDVATELARDVESEQTQTQTSTAGYSDGSGSYPSGTGESSAGPPSDGVWGLGVPSHAEGPETPGGAEPRAA